jgi:hypothetical protein
MATLKKHGSLLGKAHYLTFDVAYMSDGHNLKNGGYGWRRHKRWKAGADIQAAVKSSLALHAAREQSMPLWCEYRRQLHAACPLSLRWKMHATIQLMPDDADGVWSTMDDFQHHFGVGEIIRLCAAYRAHVAADASERAAHDLIRKATVNPTATTASEDAPK